MAGGGEPEPAGEVAGRERDGVLERGAGVFPSSGLAARHTDRVPQAGLLGQQSGRRGQHRERLGGPPALDQVLPPHRPHLGMAGILLAQPLQVPPRLIEAAEAHEGQRAQQPRRLEAAVERQRVPRGRQHPVPVLPLGGHARAADEHAGERRVERFGAAEHGE